MRSFSAMVFGAGSELVELRLVCQRDRADARHRAHSHDGQCSAHGSRHLIRPPLALSVKRRGLGARSPSLATRSSCDRAAMIALMRVSFRSWCAAPAVGEPTARRFADIRPPAGFGRLARVSSAMLLRCRRSAPGQPASRGALGGAPGVCRGVRRALRSRACAVRRYRLRVVSHRWRCERCIDTARRSWRPAISRIPGLRLSTPRSPCRRCRLRSRQRGLRAMGPAESSGPRSCAR